MWKTLSVLFLMGSMLLFPSWAAMPNQVRVRLFEAYPGIQRVRIHGNLQLLKPMKQTLPTGDYEFEIQRRQMVLIKSSMKQPVVRSNSILLKPLQGSVSVQPERIRVGQYTGLLEFNMNAQGKIEIHNEVPARTYVAVVVGSETLPGWPVEALKAQAVLTQTGLNRYQAGDVVGDSTQREVYLGLSHSRPEVRRAVNDVWGQILQYNGRPLTPFYHASCGGRTSDGRLLDPKKSIPWLTAVHCPYCSNAAFSKATRTTIPKSTFRNFFKDSIPTVIQADQAGRPLLMQFKNGKQISGYDFWIQLGRQFGWDKAPGMRFSLMPLSNGDIRITSTGAGHGLGLCQWGAAGMAKQGKLYSEILRFYFPKANLSKP